MKKILQVILFLTISFIGFGQQLLWINELDCDTPSFDDEEFLEIKSLNPGFSLDGYVVVFFNGADRAFNQSYYAVDLSGFKTDVNGIFLIGNAGVVPFPRIIIPDNTIQNGADGVAIYKRSIDDFPPETTAFVDETLVDALVYGTNDPDAVSMLEIFREFDPNIKQINEGKANNTNSIQRDNNGNYFIATPTPGVNNDGSGVVLTSIKTVFPELKFSEGDTFYIDFISDKMLDEDLVIEYSLDNEAFDSNDYVAESIVVIPKGNKTISSRVIIHNDGIDEGDEEMVFLMEPLPETYIITNNHVVVRVEDVNYKVADYGTPINPTYGKVANTAPSGYYDSLDGKSGQELKQALQDIIANPDVVRYQTYNEAIDILKESDENPLKSSQVWLVYLEKGRSKIDYQTASLNTEKWNREHVWPRSRGVFFGTEYDIEFDGIDNYLETNADSIRHGYGDMHHIRVADGPENSRRGNQFFGQYNGPPGNAGSFKGDVARSIFYMAVRYNGLEVVDGFPENETGKFGDLATLLEWHRQDPADDFEMNRNNVIQKWQFNRNPFIDYPELIEYIWGNKKGQVWNNPSSSLDVLLQKITLFPNPSVGLVNISGLDDNFKVEVFTLSGEMIRTLNCENNCAVDLQGENSGTYVFKITSKLDEIFSVKVILK